MLDDRCTYEIAQRTEGQRSEGERPAFVLRYFVANFWISLPREQDIYI